MNEQKHTPGPWAVSLSDTVTAGDPLTPAHRLIADCERTPHSKRPAPIDPEDAANARRIVACVNACEGISTETLEGGTLAAGKYLDVLSRIKQATKQRDELLEHGTDAAQWLDLIKQNYPDMAGLIRALTALRAAIAKCKQ